MGLNFIIRQKSKWCEAVSIDVYGEQFAAKLNAIFSRFRKVKLVM